MLNRKIESISVKKVFSHLSIANSLFKVVKIKAIRDYKNWQLIIIKIAKKFVQN